MSKPAKPTNKKQKVLEVKYEELEQYDSRWDDEVIAKKEEQYASCIGSFLIWFSNLEHSLDIELANLILECSHDKGYLIIKDLEMFEKIELFYNLAFPQVNLAEKKKVLKLKQLNTIRKQLEDIIVLRNKIAHAKWNTLDEDGFVRVDTKTNKENGFIKFRKFKITPTIMRQGMRDIENLAEKLSTFTDNIWQ
jgi:hypothetical protein